MRACAHPAGRSPRVKWAVQGADVVQLACHVLAHMHEPLPRLPDQSAFHAHYNSLRRLLGSPYITATPADWPPADAQRQAAAAAAEQAGEVLPARLLHMVHALAGSSWASWLQGGLTGLGCFAGCCLHARLAWRR